MGYELIDDVEIYGLFAWKNDAYLRHDRPDNDDQLIYFEKHVRGGVHWQILEQLSLDLSAGWAFDRFYFEGEDYGDRGDNRLDIDDGPIAQLSVRMTF